MGCGASFNGDAAREKYKRRGNSLSKQSLIFDSTGSIAETYTVEKKPLGEGSYGFVSKCTCKKTSEIRACKTIKKRKNKMDRFRKEVAMMKMMDHPNIIKLYETYEDHRNLYLVMELCLGGELLDHIMKANHFSEVQAAVVMQQVFRAMFYMHSLSIAHRDIKPENFLFASKDGIEESMLKLIDFGFATECREGSCMGTKVGTPYYVAPEVLHGKYDKAADMWSCGVICYVLLCGYPPFYGASDQEVMEKVKKGIWHFKKSDWTNISEDAKHLIAQLLKVDPRRRMNAEDALNHLWVKSRAPDAKDVSLSSNFMESLKSFKSHNSFKKAALQIIAKMMSEREIKGLRECFMAYDCNGDGQLTSEEFVAGLQKSGFKISDFNLEEVDSDGNGFVDYTEFLAATLDRKQYQQEEVCWAAFRMFDRDGNGFISKEEIAFVLGDGDVKNVAKRDLAELMAQIDANGDGEIDFEEFMQMMRCGPAEDDDSVAGA